METIITPILSIVAVVNVMLALIIFSRGLKSLADYLFGFIAISCCLWCIAIIGFYSTQYVNFVNWITFTHSFALLIPMFFLIFSLSFPKVQSFRKFASLASLIICLVFQYLIYFTNLIIGGTINKNYILGPGYIYYSILLMVFFTVGFVFLYFQLRKTKDLIQRKQILYVLIGSLVASSLAIIPDLIFPYINIFNYTWLGPIFTLLMVTSLFVAMLKYRLFNIKVILTEITSIAIVIALLLEVISANSATELFLKLIVLVIVTIFSFLLVRGVNREIEQREHIQKLATDLEKANVRLTELDRQKSEFVSFATHQLRAPLTAMKGYSSLLLDGDMGELPAQAKDGINHIYESAKTLTGIVDDYLNISRIELGTMKYAFETIDLQLLVNDVIAELKPNIDKTGLKFTFKAIPSEIGYRVTADRDKMKQVFANLIDNSVKYTPSGKVDVTLEFDKETRLFVFKIKDTGVGIAPETLPHLFQKFTRAQNANKVNIRGTGLGLYVARQIIEAHQGLIRAESPGEGKGSTFVVELEPFEKA